MTSNEDQLYKRFVSFKDMIDRGDFLVDKTGVKIVELRAETITLDPRQPSLDLGPKKTNDAYVAKELIWYLSQDRNIDGWVDDVKIWQLTADKNGLVNSNYGWCIFSKENGSQFENALQELIASPDSRRASMIYTRPSMWHDWNENERNDFMCTHYVQVYIRNNELQYHVHQRSCDTIFGFFNDFAWHCYVYMRFHKEYLNKTGESLRTSESSMKYIIDSLHVYERHFDLVKKIVEADHGL
jgi:thymidylate synthase